MSIAQQLEQNRIDRAKQILRARAEGRREDSINAWFDALDAYHLSYARNDGFNPDQPRAEDGRFGEVSGSSGSSSESRASGGQGMSSRSEKSTKEKSGLGALSKKVPTKALHAMREAHDEADRAAGEVYRGIAAVKDADAESISAAASAMGVEFEFKAHTTADEVEDALGELNSDGELESDYVAATNPGETLDIGDYAELFDPEKPSSLDDYEEEDINDDLRKQVEEERDTYRVNTAARAKAASKIIAHAEKVRAKLISSKVDPDKIAKAAAKVKSSEEDFKAEAKTLKGTTTEDVLGGEDENDHDEETAAAVESVFEAHEDHEPRASSYTKAAKAAAKLNKSIDADVAKLDRVVARMQKIANKKASAAADDDADDDDDSDSGDIAGNDDD